MTSVPFSCTRLSSEFNDWQVLQIIRFVLSCPSRSPHLTVINGTTVHIFHKLRFNVVQMLTDGNFWSKNSQVGHEWKISRDGPEDITGCEIVPVWRGTARFIVRISCLFLFLIIYRKKHEWKLQTSGWKSQGKVCFYASYRVFSDVLGGDRTVKLLRCHSWPTRLNTTCVTSRETLWDKHTPAGHTEIFLYVSTSKYD